MAANPAQQRGAHPTSCALSTGLESTAPSSLKIPNVPETLDIPNVPEALDIPGVPDALDIPDALDMPGVPQTLDIPDVLEALGIPGVPQALDIPNVPDALAIPGVPSSAGHQSGHVQGSVPAGSPICLLVSAPVPRCVLIAVNPSLNTLLTRADNLVSCPRAHLSRPVPVGLQGCCSPPVHHSEPAALLLHPTMPRTSWGCVKMGTFPPLVLLYSRFLSWEAPWDPIISVARLELGLLLTPATQGSGNSRLCSLGRGWAQQAQHCC